MKLKIKVTLMLIKRKLNNIIHLTILTNGIKSLDFCQENYHQVPHGLPH